jgi:hypothetical protein
MRRIIFVAVAVAVALIAVRLNQRTRMEHLEAGKGDIGSLEGDQQVLAQLRKAGGDLSKPTQVNYYLYFHDRVAADSAASAVGPGPLSATVQRAADDSAWLCFVTGRMIPSQDAIRGYTTRLVQLAKTYHGEYDGWEAALAR